MDRRKETDRQMDMLIVRQADKWTRMYKYRQTNGQTVGLIDRKIDKQIERQIDRQMELQIERQTDKVRRKYIYRKTNGQADRKTDCFAVEQKHRQTNKKDKQIFLSI